MEIIKLTEEHFDEVETLIENTIRNVNSKEYSKWVIEFMLRIDPFRPRNTFEYRDYFVCKDWNNKVLWVIWLEDNEIKTFFVSSESRWKGVWKLLIDYVENILKSQNYKISTLYSSVSAKTFYEGHNYRVIKKDISKIWKEVMLRYYMEKNIN